MNIINQLKEKFNTTEPIFDYEIYDLGYSDIDISDTLENNVFEEILGVSLIPCRIFTLVEYVEFFDDYLKVNKDSEEVIYKYFLGKDFEYGCLDGFCSLNKLGLSNQVCFSMVVKSLRVKEKAIFNNITLLPSENKYNDFMLEMFIVAFKEYKDYFDMPYSDALEIIKSKLSEYQYQRFEKEINC